jgi:hypothetical protein
MVPRIEGCKVFELISKTYTFLGSGLQLAAVNYDLFIIRFWHFYDKHSP